MINSQHNAMSRQKRCTAPMTKRWCSRPPMALSCCKITLSCCAPAHVPVSAALAAPSERRQMLFWVHRGFPIPLRERGLYRVLRSRHGRCLDEVIEFVHSSAIMTHSESKQRQSNGSNRKGLNRHRVAEQRWITE